MNKTVVWTIVIIVAIIIGLLLFSGRSPSASQSGDAQSPGGSQEGGSLSDAPPAAQDVGRIIDESITPDSEEVDVGDII